MGQSASSSARPVSVSSRRTQSDNSDTGNNTPVVAAVAGSSVPTRQQERSRTASIRRSVLGLVRSSSGSASPRSVSSGSSPSVGGRRGWRASRRWSKSPEELQTPDSGLSSAGIRPNDESGDATLTDPAQASSSNNSSNSTALTKPQGDARGSSWRRWSRRSSKTPSALNTSVAGASHVTQNLLERAGTGTPNGEVKRKAVPAASGSREDPSPSTEEIALPALNIVENASPSSEVPPDPSASVSNDHRSQDESSSRPSASRTLANNSSSDANITVHDVHLNSRPHAYSSHSLVNDSPSDMSLTLGLEPGDAAHIDGPVPVGPSPLGRNSPVNALPPLSTNVRSTQSVPSAPANDNPQTASRPFPPAGTLVVVQGVVHTTETAAGQGNQAAPAPTTTSADHSTIPDAADENFAIGRGSPTRTSSLSRPTTDSRSRSRGAERRHRLSNLLLRPTPPASARATPVPSSAHLPVSATESIGAEIPTARENLTVPPVPDSRASDVSNARPPPLSSSSIDVLGTLLSVAAAATAASLVTGSSDPLLSSGLANPSGSDRRTSLGGDALGAGIASSPFAAAAASRERRRTAWEALRERLGLARSGPSATSAAGEPVDGASGLAGLSGTTAGASTPGTRPDGTPMDAREMMLAEMVRALNHGLGFGVNANGTASPTPDQAQLPGSPTTSATPVDGNAAPAAPAAPAEGSFEQFLLNLQVDLRRALTEETEDAVLPSPAIPVRLASSSMANTPVTPSRANPSTRPRRARRDNRDADSSIARVTTQESSNEDDESDRDTMPSLQSMTDSSDSELDDDDDDDVADADDEDDERASDASPMHASPLFPPAGRTALPNIGAGPSRERGINWWRLYRFPPMPAPQARGLAAAARASSATPATPSTPLIPTASSSSASGSPTSDISSTPSLPISAGSPPSSNADPADNVVVPIIVVGLQSVNSDHHHAHDFDHDHGHDLGPDRTSQDDPDGPYQPSSPLAEDASGTGTARSGSPRGRTWQSRAANALRGLRPARRPLDNQPVEGPGSRTFLIYVIGGYYPPNHHIVTGSDNLDSFEALLELAELLGQVKPPVASKEDIEKSGLEIIKPADLERYEKEGRVASNCVDRCLICLDDYAPEDELRLMSCRHTFHKGCVDRWMQTGKNNCPACRSKGVSVDSDVPNSSATASSSS